MAITVKAFVPQGEAVQVHFEDFHGSKRIRVPHSAPAWFRNWVFEAMKSDAINRYGFVPLPGAQGNHWMTGIVSGWWLIRGSDGQLIGIPPEQFEWFYQRQTKEDQQHG